MSLPPTASTYKFGIMIVEGENEPIPLKVTRVNAHLNGFSASVIVIQEFINPHEKVVELAYLFPLSHEAALIDFKIQIGSRTIQANLREREDARLAYEQARDMGQQAALLDQVRPNLFRMNIANVRPNESVQTSLQYEERIAIQTDSLEFVFPMGLTPRYESPNQSKEKQPINPPYDIGRGQFGTVEIQITLNTGFITPSPLSPSHKLDIEAVGSGIYLIRLAGTNYPDHDFVLRIPLPEKPIEMAAWCGKDTGSEILLANWLPGESPSLDHQSAPREFVFVLDRSGSMSGEPIRQARNAMRACLRILDAQDAFRILLFDDQLEWYQIDAATVDNPSIHQADTYLNHIEGRGGTEILPALEAVLNLPVNADRTRYIIFLTDGAVSAEDQALTKVRKKLGSARIFTFGIGPSVNRALLAKMAKLGRGSAEFLQLDEDIEGAILRFQDKVAFPALTDITLNWQNCQSWDIYPAQFPDLYSGQSLQMVARFKRNPQGKPASLKISGRMGGQIVHYEIILPPVDADFLEANRLWAKARIDDLLERTETDVQMPHQFRQEIISLALEYKIVTPYTVFVALDSEIVNPSGEMMPVAVLHPLPQGLDWHGFLPTLPAPHVVQAVAQSPAAGNSMAAPFPRTIFDARSSTPFVQKSANAPGSTQRAKTQNYPSASEMDELSSTHEVETTEMVLRRLARTQELDGSWNQNIEFTSAALIAFVRSGYTARHGHYRKQVSRAAEWLSKIKAAGTDAYTQAFALAELSFADRELNWLLPARLILSNLPAPQSEFEVSVAAIIHQGVSRMTAPQGVHPANREALRLAAIIGATQPVEPSHFPADQQELAKVWACSIRVRE